MKTANMSHEKSWRRKPLNTASFLIILMDVFSVLSLTCHPTEYLTDQDCCPKCAPGSRVKTHCTEYTSISCLPCIAGTFMDEPTGRTQCFTCTNWAPGSGLRIKSSCTTTSDTACEPLEGFFCIDSKKDNCMAAQKHRSCQPGQYISQKGTAFTDTVCTDCSSGTFSNGTLTSCQPHTQCESLNLQLTKPGTASTDAECSNLSSSTTGPVIIVVVLVLVMVVGAGASVFVFVRHRKRKHPQNSEIRRNGGDDPKKDEISHL